MTETLMVGFGGFFGSIARYHLGGYLMLRYATPGFPVGTFVVNLVGCFLIGLLAGFIERSHTIPGEYRLLLITGLLGGFTTFSAFSYESIFLIRRGMWATVTLYVVGSVTFGLLLAALGILISRPPR